MPNTYFAFVEYQLYLGGFSYTYSAVILVSDLINVFEVFLPQLLLYPNPTDPLNGEAAALMMRDRIVYEQKVKGIHFIILCVLVQYIKIEIPGHNLRNLPAFLMITVFVTHRLVAICLFKFLLVATNIIRVLATNSWVFT